MDLIREFNKKIMRRVVAAKNCVNWHQIKIWVSYGKLTMAATSVQGNV